jgi:hypothetical protein
MRVLTKSLKSSKSIKTEKTCIEEAEEEDFEPKVDILMLVEE